MVNAPLYLGAHTQTSAGFSSTAWVGNGALKSLDHDERGLAMLREQDVFLEARFFEDAGDAWRYQDPQQVARDVWLREKAMPGYRYYHAVETDNEETGDPARHEERQRYDRYMAERCRRIVGDGKLAVSFNCGTGNFWAADYLQFEQTLSLPGVAIGYHCYGWPSLWSPHLAPWHAERPFTVHRQLAASGFRGWGIITECGITKLLEPSGLDYGFKVVKSGREFWEQDLLPLNARLHENRDLMLGAFVFEGGADPHRGEHYDWTTFDYVSTEAEVAMRDYRVLNGRADMFREGTVAPQPLDQRIGQGFRDALAAHPGLGEPLPGFDFEQYLTSVVDGNVHLSWLPCASGRLIWDKRSGAVAIIWDDGRVEAA